MESKHVPAGSYLFRIGDEDNCIYVVQSGKINVYITEGVCHLFILVTMHFCLSEKRSRQLITLKGLAPAFSAFVFRQMLHGSM